jgi:hypothetical protein
MAEAAISHAIAEYCHLCTSQQVAFKSRKPCHQAPAKASPNIRSPIPKTNPCFLLFEIAGVIR